MPDVTQFADKANFIIEMIGSTLAAQVLDAAPATVNRWAAGKYRPRNIDTERCLENLYLVLRYVRDEGTNERVRSNDEVPSWMLGMKPRLDDDSPAEAFRDGDYKAVMAAARSHVQDA